MPYRVVQYQIKAEPIPLGAPERSTLDKWLPTLPDLPVRRLLPSTPLGSLSFEPYFYSGPTPIYVNSQACEPIKVEHIQYQAKAEPVIVPVEAPESLTLDKWALNTEQPALDIKRTQYVLPSTFDDRLFQAPAAPAPIYVSAQSAEPIAIQHFQYQAEAKPVFVTTEAPETLTLDKWSSAWPQPQVRPPRLIQYGVNIAVAEQPDDGLPPVWWLPESNNPLRIRAQNVATGFFEILLTSFGETVSLDKWWIQGHEPRLTSRQQYLQPQMAADHLALEAISLDKWDCNYPDLIFRPQRLPDYSHFSIDPTLGAERASLDKWAQPTNLPRFERWSTPWLYPSLAIDAQLSPAEIVHLDKWDRQYPELIFRTRRLADYTHFSLDPTLQAERVSIDKWWAESVASWPALRPLMPTNDLLFVPEPESLTLDKWWQQSVDPTGPRPLLILPEQFVFIVESVGLDKWLTEPQIIRVPERRIYTPSEAPLLVTWPYLPEQQAEPTRARVWPLMLNAPDVLPDMLLWQELTQQYMPRARTTMRHFEGVNVVMVIAGELVATSRTIETQASASIYVTTTSASVRNTTGKTTVKSGR